MKKFRRALIVGKFAPLHLGHDFLIRKALSLTDELVILSYSNPEFPFFSPSLRKNWLMQSYPNAKVVVLGLNSTDPQKVPLNSEADDTHRDFVAKVYFDLIRQPLDVVFTSESYGDGFAIRLSQRLKEWGLQQHAVQHINVDQERRAFPLSGTELRKDIHQNRKFLAPGVYKDFVKSVCFLGAESTGKSTLARALAESQQTTFADEFGRTLWVEQKGILLFEDFIKIAKTQIAKEVKAQHEAYKFFFADTSPLTTLFYCQEYHGKVSAELEEMSFRDYDFTFLCAPDFDMVQDGTRANDDFRNRQHEWYLRILNERKIKYHLLTGSLQSRCHQVLKLIELPNDKTNA